MTEVNTPSILIIDEMNSLAVASNGINNVITDFVKFGSTKFDISLAGLGDRNLVGRWVDLEISGVSTRYFTLGGARNQIESRFLRSTPASLLLAYGLLKYRKNVGLRNFDFVQAHRVEIGALLVRILRTSPVQFIHNAKQNLTGRFSDSFWRFFPWAYSILEKTALRGSIAVGVFNLQESQRLSQIDAKALRCRTWFDQTKFNIESRTSEETNPKRKIVWVGRLDAQKNPLRALKVFKELAARMPEAELHIFGDGPLRNEMEAECVSLKLSSVYMHGAVTKSVLANFYKSSSALLMTSHYEGSPTVLVEALACGVPAVVNADSDPDLLISKGINGNRLENPSEKELAEALLNCLDLNPVIVSHSVQDRSAQRLCLETLIALHSKFRNMH